MGQHCIITLKQVRLNEIIKFFYNFFYATKNQDFFDSCINKKIVANVLTWAHITTHTVIYPLFSPRLLYAILLLNKRPNEFRNNSAKSFDLF